MHERPNDPEVPKIHSSMEAATSPGEVVIFEIKKHWFGLFVMYFQALVAFTIIGWLFMVLLPDVLGSDQETTNSIAALTLVVFGGLLGIILLIVTYIYWGNKLVLTNRNITQVATNGLFARKVSELALQNAEDITADKKGIWAYIFNFGEIRVETAGEQFNFHFKYCPNPNYYGQQILDTRQQVIRENPKSH